MDTSINQYIEPIKSSLQKIQSFKSKGFSDVYYKDNQIKLQFVDLVLEGGGVLGIGLVGYLYALEEAGIRFLSIAGTSAGSIIALLLMAIGKREERKAEKLLKILSEVDLSSFIDGDDDAKDFSNLLGSGELSSKPIKIIIKGAQIIDNLVEDYGLNPGTEFKNWLRDRLSNEGIITVADLNKKIKILPPKLLQNQKYKNLSLQLKIIACDITTQTKVEFPEYAKNYWENPDDINPAEFVRASMSIPFFFQPYKRTNLKKIPKLKENWKKIASFDKEIPDEVYFTDGGIMSNFPINAFHVPGIPLAPTFGVKLGKSEREINEVNGILSYMMAVLNSARHNADYDFLLKHEDYKHLIAFVNTDEFNWLDFKMKEEDKIKLFAEGVKAGVSFLEKFNFADYKKIRKSLNAK